MSIYEYDEERHMRNVRKEEREEGREEGRKEGRKEAVELFQKLMESGRDDELKRALSDREYLEELYREYGMKDPG